VGVMKFSSLLVEILNSETKQNSFTIYIWGRMPSSGMLGSVALVRTYVSKKRIATIIRVRRLGELGTLAVTSNRSTQRKILIIRYSETSVLTRATRCNITEGGILHSHPCKNPQILHMNSFLKLCYIFLKHPSKLQTVSYLEYTAKYLVAFLLKCSTTYCMLQIMKTFKRLFNPLCFFVFMCYEVAAFKTLQ
jgi:hypothetical protein